MRSAVVGSADRVERLSGLLQQSSPIFTSPSRAAASAASQLMAPHVVVHRQLEMIGPGEHRGPISEHRGRGTLSRLPTNSRPLIAGRVRRRARRWSSRGAVNSRVKRSSVKMRDPAVYAAKIFGPSDHQRSDRERDRRHRCLPDRPRPRPRHPIGRATPRRCSIALGVASIRTSSVPTSHTVPCGNTDVNVATIDFRSGFADVVGVDPLADDAARRQPIARAFEKLLREQRRHAGNPRIRRLRDDHVVLAIGQQRDAIARRR